MTSHVVLFGDFDGNFLKNSFKDQFGIWQWCAWDTGSTRYISVTRKEIPKKITQTKYLSVDLANICVRLCSWLAFDCHVTVRVPHELIDGEATTNLTKQCLICAACPSLSLSLSLSPSLCLNSHHWLMMMCFSVWFEVGAMLWVKCSQAKYTDRFTV